MKAESNFGESFKFVRLSENFYCLHFSRGNMFELYKLHATLISKSKLNGIPCYF